MAKSTLGLIVGNRDVFPIELAQAGRDEILALLAKEKIDVVVLGPNETPGGVVSSWKDAEKCARLFRENASKIDGILVTLPNFGDERGVADALKVAALSVPVFVHAWPDTVGEFSVEQRRDSFCGKLSVCNNLKQYSIPYSIGKHHVIAPIE